MVESIEEEIGAGELLDMKDYSGSMSHGTRTPSEAASLGEESGGGVSGRRRCGQELKTFLISLREECRRDVFHRFRPNSAQANALIQAFDRMISHVEDESSGGIQLSGGDLLSLAAFMQKSFPKSVPVVNSSISLVDWVARNQDRINHLETSMMFDFLLPFQKTSQLLEMPAIHSKLLQLSVSLAASISIHQNTSLQTNHFNTLIKLLFFFASQPSTSDEAKGIASGALQFLITKLLHAHKPSRPFLPSRHVPNPTLHYIIREIWPQPQQDHARSTAATADNYSQQRRRNQTSTPPQTLEESSEQTSHQIQQFQPNEQDEHQRSEPQGGDKGVSPAEAEEQFFASHLQSPAAPPSVSNSNNEDLRDKSVIHDLPVQNASTSDRHFDHKQDLSTAPASELAQKPDDSTTNEPAPDLEETETEKCNLVLCSLEATEQGCEEDIPPRDKKKIFDVVYYMELLLSEYEMSLASRFSKVSSPQDIEKLALAADSEGKLSPETFSKLLLTGGAPPLAGILSSEESTQDQNKDEATRTLVAITVLQYAIELLIQDHTLFSSEIFDFIRQRLLPTLLRTLAAMGLIAFPLAIVLRACNLTAQLTMSEIEGVGILGLSVLREELVLGLHFLVSQLCNPDATSPQSKKRQIVAVQFLTEGCLGNQAFLRELIDGQIEDPLSQFVIQLIARAFSRLSMIISHDSPEQISVQRPPQQAPPIIVTPSTFVNRLSSFTPQASQSAAQSLSSKSLLPLLSLLAGKRFTFLPAPQDVTSLHESFHYKSLSHNDDSLPPPPPSTLLTPSQQTAEESQTDRAPASKVDSFFGGHSNLEKSRMANWARSRSWLSLTSLVRPHTTLAREVPAEVIALLGPPSNRSASELDKTRHNVVQEAALIASSQISMILGDRIASDTENYETFSAPPEEKGKKSDGNRRLTLLRRRQASVASKKYPEALRIFTRSLLEIIINLHRCKTTEKTDAVPSQLFSQQAPLLQAFTSVSLLCLELGDEATPFEMAFSPATPSSPALSLIVLRLAAHAGPSLKPSIAEQIHMMTFRILNKSAFILQKDVKQLLREWVAWSQELPPCCGLFLESLLWHEGDLSSSPFDRPRMRQALEEVNFFVKDELDLLGDGELFELIGYLCWPCIGTDWADGQDLTATTSDMGSQIDWLLHRSTMALTSQTSDISKRLKILESLWQNLPLLKSAEEEKGTTTIAIMSTIVQKYVVKPDHQEDFVASLLNFILLYLMAMRSIKGFLKENLPIIQGMLSGAPPLTRMQNLIWDFIAVLISICQLEVQELTQAAEESQSERNANATVIETLNAQSVDTERGQDGHVHKTETAEQNSAEQQFAPQKPTARNGAASCLAASESDVISPLFDLLETFIRDYGLTIPTSSAVKVVSSALLRIAKRRESGESEVLPLKALSLIWQLCDGLSHVEEPDNATHITDGAHKTHKIGSDTFYLVSLSKAGAFSSALGAEGFWSVGNRLISKDENAGCLILDLCHELSQLALNPRPAVRWAAVKSLTTIMAVRGATWFNRNFDKFYQDVFDPMVTRLESQKFQALEVADLHVKQAIDAQAPEDGAEIDHEPFLRDIEDVEVWDEIIAYCVNYSLINAKESVCSSMVDNSEKSLRACYAAIYRWFDHHQKSMRGPTQTARSSATLQKAVFSLIQKQIHEIARVLCWLLEVTTKDAVPINVRVNSLNGWLCKLHLLRTEFFSASELMRLRNPLLHEKVSLAHVEGLAEGLCRFGQNLSIDNSALSRQQTADVVKFKRSTSHHDSLSNRPSLTASLFISLVASLFQLSRSSDCPLSDEALEVYHGVAKKPVCSLRSIYAHTEPPEVAHWVYDCYWNPSSDALRARLPLLKTYRDIPDYRNSTFAKNHGIGHNLITLSALVCSSRFSTFLNNSLVDDSILFSPIDAKFLLQTDQEVSTYTAYWSQCALWLILKQQRDTFAKWQSEASDAEHDFSFDTAVGSYLPRYSQRITLLIEQSEALWSNGPTASSIDILSALMITIMTSIENWLVFLRMKENRSRITQKTELDVLKNIWQTFRSVGHHVDDNKIAELQNLAAVMSGIGIWQLCALWIPVCIEAGLYEPMGGKILQELNATLISSDSILEDPLSFGALLALIQLCDLLYRSEVMLHLSSMPTRTPLETLLHALNQIIDDIVLDADHETGPFSTFFALAAKPFRRQASRLTADAYERAETLIIILGSLVNWRVSAADCRTRECDVSASPVTASFCPIALSRPLLKLIDLDNKPIRSAVRQTLQSLLSSAIPTALRSEDESLL